MNEGGISRKKKKIKTDVLFHYVIFNYRLCGLSLSHAEESCSSRHLVMIPPPVGICFVHRFQLTAEFFFFFSLEQWSTSAEGVRITRYQINLEVVGCRVMQSTSSPRQFFCSLFSCFVSFSFFLFFAA
jgi:hypothetical protein